jgi:hypothetical protein
VAGQLGEGRPNPYSRHLRQLLPEDQQQQVEDLFRQWDALEALIVRVYRNRCADDQDEAAYAKLRAWFGQGHGRLDAAIDQADQRTRGAAGNLLSQASAAEFVDNWSAVRQLATVREALNLALMARISQ